MAAIGPGQKPRLRPRRPLIGVDPACPVAAMAGSPCWPGAGAALVSRGFRSLGSTCRRSDVADSRGPRHASPASAIEASSAAAVAKLDGADW
jgi:hypothetical protein